MTNAQNARARIASANTPNTWQEFATQQARRCSGADTSASPVAELGRGDEAWLEATVKGEYHPHAERGARRLVRWMRNAVPRAWDAACRDAYAGGSGLTHAMIRARVEPIIKLCEELYAEAWRLHLTQLAQ